MRKIKSLAKYEIINLKRGKLIWIIGILYLFGVQQETTNMKLAGEIFLSVTGLVINSWLPLNLIMIPLILLFAGIGKSSNEIFKVMDISKEEVIVSKWIVVGMVNLVIFLSSIGIYLFFSLIGKASISYSLYESFGYIVSNLVFLLVCSSIGLFIGQIINKYLYEVVGVILILVLFIPLCNFYKTTNGILPLIDIATVPSSINIINYDRSFLYHNIFWIVFSFILIIATILFENSKRNRSVFKIIGRCALIVSVLLCIFLGIGISNMQPSFYDILSRQDVKSKNGSSSGYDGTFFGNSDVSYYVDKYNMNIYLDKSLRNDCDMEVKITNANVKTIELGLYKSLKILSLQVNDKKADYERTKNSFIVRLPKECKKDDIISIRVVYEGDVDTEWSQGKELFYVKNNSTFLGDVFEWYPKLNDSHEKEYNISLKDSGKTKIYSNLDGEKFHDKYTFKGKDREVFLMSGMASERNYKGYLFIGNPEYIKDNEQCDDLIEYLNRNNNPIKKVVFGPFVPGSTKMDKPYETAVFWPIDK